MRPSPIVATWRHKLVIELRRRHPQWTLQDIADRASISRERVRQILKDADLQTKAYPIESRGDYSISKMENRLNFKMNS